MTDDADDQRLKSTTDALKAILGKYSGVKPTLNKHFNQSSNKILAVDEMLKRSRESLMEPVEEAWAVGFLEELAEWQDGGGRLYVREMLLKEAFSKMSAIVKSEVLSAQAAEEFPKIQKIMDESEDHTERLKAGKLFPKVQ